MPKCSIRLWLAVIAASMANPVVVTIAAQGRPAVPSSAPEAPLKRFLQNYLESPFLSADRSTRYSAASVDLSGHGKPEVIVYLTGKAWCGTGGCLMLILAPEDSSYRVIARVTVARTPVRVLDQTSDGWRNLGVWVEGGGVEPGYEAELRFDGKTYPPNPSSPSVHPAGAGATGRVVLSTSQRGEPLYP
jgi:hypothetical protein